MAKADDALVSMKLPPRKKADKEIMYPDMAKAPEYPYGLQITLENEQLKALGIDKLPSVGEALTIQAKVEVCSVSQYESNNGPDRRSIGLQITDLAVS